jgi:hypothetical protein
MTGQQTKISQTRAAAERFGTFSDLVASLSKTELGVPSEAEAITGSEQENDAHVSTLSAYKADVTLYLAVLHRRSFGGE